MLIFIDSILREISVTERWRASERQGLNFESCVWRTVSSYSSHHPQEVRLARFNLYVHKHVKCVLKPH